jgi:hypothetical protein
MFVDGIVEHFKNTMMESSLIGVTDVHAGAFANSFKSLKFVNLSGTVNIASSSVLFLWNVAVVERDDWFGRWVFGHGRCGRFSIPSEGGRRAVCNSIEGRDGRGIGQRFFLFFRRSKRRIWGIGIMKPQDVVGGNIGRCQRS